MENKFFDDEPFEGKDIGMKPLTEADMPQCASCKYSTGMPGECTKYRRKPNGVVINEAKCELHEEK